MPAPTTTDFRNRRNVNESRSSSRGPGDAGQRTQGRGGSGKEKTKEATFMDRWVEPPLAMPKPSYQDQPVGPYGLLEHMQPLGEAPNAKAKARVKPDGVRKSVLGRSAAGAALDPPETPEGTPAPMPGTPPLVEPQMLQSAVIDDERDADYAPTMNGKKDRTTRSRAVKRKSDSASSATPAPLSTTTEAASSAHHHRFEYEEAKIRRIVDSAKERAVEVGRPEVAAAVDAVYKQSLTEPPLKVLLEAILKQDATAQQVHEFQAYVKAAKKKLKDAKDKGRQSPPAERVNGSQERAKQPPATPKLTVRPASASRVESPIPSTERPEGSRPKISLKVNKSPSKHSSRRRSGHNNMSTSPKKRSGSFGSDSSLTSLTSNEDNNDFDRDEPVLNDDEPGPSSGVNGVFRKDHAAERGSLTIPGGAVKRSSAEAELEEERDRALAAKKQKLNETVARDYEYQESNVRPERPAPRSRVARFKESGLAQAVRRESNGSRNASARGSRAPSMDIDSPLSELSPVVSRDGTPKLYEVQQPKVPGKRAKTKQSPEKKPLGAFGGMSGASGARRESPVGDDDNEELDSENNDFCSACGGSGYLLCCDGCDRSFHFTCLDPPLHADAKELDEPWYCYICIAKRPITADSADKPLRGLFAPLLNGLRKRNPRNFELPESVRNYFEGVATDKEGAFIEALNATKATRSRPGYSEDQPDYFKLRDSKQNLVQCYACGRTSSGKRPIVTCDHCSQHWHLDCLDPPLSNPPALNHNGKKVHDWMCPLHADQELRHVPLALLNQHQRTLHIRRPRKPKTKETALNRGFRNNGLIEVVDDETDASDSEFYDHDDGGTVYKLPAHGIKLDFIDKVKNTRLQELRDEHAHTRRCLAVARPHALEQANFARRPFNEKQVALQLAQFANENQDLDLGGDLVQNLVGALIAEAPKEVCEEMLAAEDAEKARSSSSAIPPSPPSSEQPDQLSMEQRKQLQLLQELITRKLEASKT